MKVLTFMLVGLLPCVLLKGGVDAAGYGPAPDSGACGGGGAGEELGSRREPLLASEFVGQTLSEAAKKLRPIVLRSSAVMLAVVREPHFGQRLDIDPNLRDVVAKFFELQDKYFYELYGVPRRDSSFTDFFQTAREGTLRSELDKPEVRDLVVTYLEVAAGDMGGEASFWGESERRHGRCSFAKTLMLLRRLVAQEQLLEFLRSRAHQYLFFTFYSTLSRKLADQMSSPLPFDEYIIDGLRFGNLASDLKDEQWRAETVNMLCIGNSVLTASPPFIPLGRVEPSAPPEPSDLHESYRAPAPLVPPVFFTPPVPSASPEPSAPFPSYVEPELYGRPAPYAPQVTSAGPQSQPGQVHSAPPEQYPVHVPSPSPQQQLLQVPSVPTQPQPLQVPSASPQPQPGQASSAVAQPQPKQASSAPPGLSGGPESAVPPVAPAAPRSSSSLLRGLSRFTRRAKPTKLPPEKST